MQTDERFLKKYCQLSFFIFILKPVALSEFRFLDSPLYDVCLCMITLPGRLSDFHFAFKNFTNVRKNKIPSSKSRGCYKFSSEKWCFFPSINFKQEEKTRGHEAMYKSNTKYSYRSVRQVIR